MKKLAILLALLMLAGCLTACSGKETPTSEAPQATAPIPESADAEPIEGTEAPAGSTAVPTEATDAPTEATDAPAEPSDVPAETDPAEEPSQDFMPDFTVDTIDGGTFTLSEALKDHELVLVNLWASWCGPCAYEFPFLQEAWEQYQDKVAVIALSVEPDDSVILLRNYASQKGLTFPIAKANGTDLLRTFSPMGYIPATILVGRDRAVLSVEIGSKESTQEFLDLFSAHLGADSQAADQCTYTIRCLDPEGNGVPGCMLSFCDEDLCVPVGTDNEGSAVFIGAPAAYHIQALSLPEGYVIDEERSTLEAGPSSTTILVYLKTETP